MKVNNNRSSQQLFQQSKSLRSRYKSGVSEFEAKLDFMQNKIESHSSFLTCGFCSRSNKKVDDAFKRAFKTLNLNEQVDLLWKMCTFIGEIKQHKYNLEDHQIKNPQKQFLDTTIYIKDKQQYKTWTVTRIKASLKTKKIIITDTSTVLDLRHYLLRDAKNKQRECFALEAVNLHETLQTIKISNEGHSFEETIAFFHKMKQRALYDEICALMNPGLLQQEAVQTNAVNLKVSRKGSLKAPQTSFDTSSFSNNKLITLKLVSPQYSKKPQKQIQKQMLQRQRVIRLKDSSYNQIYKLLLPAGLLLTIKDFSGWQKVKSNENYEVHYHRKQQKVRKVYHFTQSQIVIFDWIVDELNNFSNFKKWKPKMDFIHCLKIFPSQKTKLFHEKYTHQNNIKINYAFIRHHFQLPNPLSLTQKPKKQFFYYDQSVTSPIAKKSLSIPQPLAEISYILWKFSEDQDKITLVVEAKCDHFVTPQQNLKMTDDYLGEFDRLKKHAAKYTEESQLDNDLILNTILFQNQYIEKIDQLEDLDHDTQYFTVTEDNPSDKQNTRLHIKTSLNTSKKLISRVSFENQPNQNSTHLLKFQHPVNPYPKSKPKLVVPLTKGGHFHWEKQWMINPKGQLINTNKQKIQAQNNVLKNVFKRLGRNIFSGKGILSISLPVDAFGQDSNLSRLCNSYGYAPIYLEQAVKCTDMIQRFKKVISFGISASVIYIRMDKPFNPILGQTYQSLIDGCPVYGEQISHHPPISSVFLKGRGYTLYGHLEAKVQMSLNSASGINDGVVNVSFHQNDLSKNKVMYTSPAGELAGLVFGQRKMALIKKSVYFDPQNLLHCELRWSKQKGKSDFINKFYDAVEGQIVKLKPNFNKENWKNIKKEDIEKQYGLINGRWTGAVFNDDQLMFDTLTAYPHQVQLYPAMLESDVQKRKDLLLRRKAIDFEPAQQAKQELEELQRNDRKLRAKYGPGGH